MDPPESEMTELISNRSKEPKEKRKIRNWTPQPLRPFRKKPWRTIILSFFLFFAGILFTTVGIEQTWEKGIGECYPYFIMAVLLLIPGLYHVVIILRIWFGSEGYTYEMLPNLEDQ